ncbi:MAG: adenosylmethionine decarboxylase, partial [Nitrososphaerota archaeon]
MGAGSRGTPVRNLDGLGRHVIGELYGCDPASLKDLDGIIDAVRRAAKEAGATIVGDFANKYDKGEGVSYILVVKESHLSVHTWPELGYASVDIYTCGDHVDPWRAFDVIAEALKPRTVSVMEIKRGLMVKEA